MLSRKRTKLARAFFDRPTLQVAGDLIGKFIVYRTQGEVLSARIVEVEAYIGEDDPASHAAPGPTARNALMYGKPGVAYIYFIYGMYHCLNFVTEHKGFPAAVLIRAGEPVDGVELMKQRNPNGAAGRALSGPGKFCQGFGLTREQNGMDLTDSTLYLEDRGAPPATIATSPRIGIRKGLERNWRFYDVDSSAVSGKRSETTKTVEPRFEMKRRLSREQRPGRKVAQV